MILKKCTCELSNQQDNGQKSSKVHKMLHFEVLSCLDPYLMRRINNEGVVILCIYGDDVLLIGDMKAMQISINDVEQKSDIFGIKDH